MIRAVLDTNILVSATLVSEGYSARLVDLWEKRRYVPLLSPMLLEEIQEVLRYPRIRRRHGWSEEEMEAYVRRLTEMAVLTSGQRTVSAVPQDPDDDVLVACALEGEADFLVTGDQHLLSLGSYEGIQIVTPAQFWQHLSRETEVRLAQVRFRPATEADAPRLLAFYQETGYAGGVTPTDVVLLAEEEDRIIGALRLCEEHGTLVLRGMRVPEERQRQGIGTRLLQWANEQIGERTCYCLPHPDQRQL